MGDPLNPWEDEDRLAPAGDLNEDAPNLTGTMTTMGGGFAMDSIDTTDSDGTTGGGAGGIGGGTTGGSHGDAMLDDDTAEREAQDAKQMAAGGVGDTGPEPGPGGTADTDPKPDANDLEADNPVEQETIDLLDPSNPPA